ncbi:hypothetical protein BKA62DRAFT_833964 [Auriculariales sp. MPI-PUGE-AT-0066]|nr:hypothetical protein BKA62DRAFT_833964 [Auriculariales sp. MPI-PUGE-AT-0066]
MHSQDDGIRPKQAPAEPQMHYEPLIIDEPPTEQFNYLLATRISRLYDDIGRLEQDHSERVRSLLRQSNELESDRRAAAISCDAARTSLNKAANRSTRLTESCINLSTQLKAEETETKEFKLKLQEQMTIVAQQARQLRDIGRDIATSHQRGLDAEQATSQLKHAFRLLRDIQAGLESVKSEEHAQLVSDAQDTQDERSRLLEEMHLMQAEINALSAGSSVAFSHEVDPASLYDYDTDNFCEYSRAISPFSHGAPLPIIHEEPEESGDSGGSNQLDTGEHSRHTVANSDDFESSISVFGTTRPRTDNAGRSADNWAFVAPTGDVIATEPAGFDLGYAIYTPADLGSANAALLTYSHRLEGAEGTPVHLQSTERVGTCVEMGNRAEILVLVSRADSGCQTQPIHLTDAAVQTCGMHSEGSRDNSFSPGHVIRAVQSLNVSPGTNNPQQFALRNRFAHTVGSLKSDFGSSWEVDLENFSHESLRTRGLNASWPVLWTMSLVLIVCSALLGVAVVLWEDATLRELASNRDRIEL